MKDIEQPFTVRVCEFLKAAPATKEALCANFDRTKSQMQSILGHLIAYGCIERIHARDTGRANFHFIVMPHKPSTGKKKKAEAAKRTQQATTGEVLRRYTPEFRPLKKRDQFAHWRLRENPETSTAAVHHFVR